MTETDVCSPSDDKIPRCFDWRNVDGVNYDSPIRQQGDCGSCYAVATISAMEARIRIKSKNFHKPILSVAGALQCSRYNQGCNGGYPELVSKFGQEQGFFAEDCFPYDSVGEKCRDQCFYQRTWKVKEYGQKLNLGYVGKGYYGSTTESAMMKEIYENGPVVVAFNAAPDLYYYSSGVFITNPKNLLIQSNEESAMGSWIFTNHAVTCVGWGETLHNEEILKYWIMKNSWGTEWGEQGYFKILRGKNLAGVENQAAFMIPKL